MPLNLCSEAITSANPPLSFEARQEVARIHTSRIESLFGHDRSHAEAFFNAIDLLPPISGGRIIGLLRQFADTDFSIAAIEAKANEIKTSATRFGLDYEESSTGPTANEWGYISLPIELITAGEPSQTTIDIDELQVERTSSLAMAKIIRNLAWISDPQLRQDLLEDAGHIVELRLCLDFTLPPEE